MPSPLIYSRPSERGRQVGQEENEEAKQTQSWRFSLFLLLVGQTLWSYKKKKKKIIKKNTIQFF